MKHLKGLKYFLENGNDINNELRIESKMSNDISYILFSKTLERVFEEYLLEMRDFPEHCWCEINSSIRSYTDVLVFDSKLIRTLTQFKAVVTTCQNLKNWFRSLANYINDHFIWALQQSLSDRVYVKRGSRPEPLRTTQNHLEPNRNLPNLSEPTRNLTGTWWNHPRNLDRKPKY